MDKKYNYQEFKIDPRTTKSRYVLALFECIDNKKTSPEEIFTAIDKAYSIGKYRSQSKIKENKKKAIKLFNKFIFE